MRAGRVVVERVRRAANADGAGESGLSSLLGAHALHSAGDALVTVALAGTVFFSVPLGQARGRVALYLLLTLLPFSLLVPVAGPVLDRFRHGRRNVLAVTAAGRGLVAWSMAGLTASLGLYPLALAVLVLSRAFGVARSAATPRVRPEDVTLVQANARMNVAGVASASLAAAVGAGIAKVVGIGWVLRLASLVLLAAAVCAVRLPAQIDEVRAPRRKVSRYRLLQAPAVVQRPLIAAVALRALAGLLTIFLAFLLKHDHTANVVIGAVLGAAVVGQLLGTAVASRLPEHLTARLTLASLVVPGLACLAAAVVGGPVLFALAAGLSGMSYALSKFALDASLQTHVPPESTSGAFARSETGLQLAWAVGGGLAVAVPTVGAVGFGVAAAVPVLGIVAGARAAAGRPLLPTWGRPAQRGADDDDTTAVTAMTSPPTTTAPTAAAPATRTAAPATTTAGSDVTTVLPLRDAAPGPRDRADAGRDAAGRTATLPVRHQHDADRTAALPVRGQDEADRTAPLPLRGPVEADDPDGRPWWLDP